MIELAQSLLTIGFAVVFTFPRHFLGDVAVFVYDRNVIIIHLVISCLNFQFCLRHLLVMVYLSYPLLYLSSQYNPRISFFVVIFSSWLNWQKIPRMIFIFKKAFLAASVFSTWKQKSFLRTLGIFFFSKNIRFESGLLANCCITKKPKSPTEQSS